MAKKKKRVPEVLWLLFGERAGTLAETIVALVPPTEMEGGGCRCNKRLGCLSCSGGEAISFLVRSDDSPEYRKLLNGSFVVVDENAPPFTAFLPQRRWTQREIVRRSIEITLTERHSSSNMICYSYDKASRSSAVVDALTSSNWKLLLKRVGAALMTYLLRYTSLFLPLPRMQHYQIAGCPINDLCLKFSRQIPEPRPLPHPLAYNGSKKRKPAEGVETIPRKRICTKSLGSGPSLKSSSFVAGTVPAGSSCVSKEDLSHNEREGSSKGNALTSHKRSRQGHWLRQRKRRQFVVQGEPSLVLCGGNHINNDKLSYCASSSQKDQGKLSDCICSIFMNVPKTNKNAEIGRNIFYKLENSTSMFPRKHILHTLKPNASGDILHTLRSNASGGAVLFNTIFRPNFIDKNAAKVAWSHPKEGCPISSTCLYHSLTKLLKTVICSSRYCQFQRLLDKHCPISTSYQDASAVPGTRLEVEGSGHNATQDQNTNSEATTDQNEPDKCCPKKEVVSFIWAVCRRIIPSPLLGGPSNWRVLRRNISKFIHLRKFEKFSLKECTYKLKITKFPLFSKLVVTDIARHAILKCWIFWLFAHVVSPLVQANFYVTETDHEKQEVLYYRKSTWEKLMREAECLKDNKYSQLNYASTRKIIWNRAFGFSKARLRPKQNGLRILTNLAAPSRMPTDPSSSEIHSSKISGRKALSNGKVSVRFFKAVNTVLHDLHVVVKGLSANEPEKLGSSVFDYNDVYRKFVPFLSLLRNGSSNVPNVFMVVSDVSKAYDSVNQDKLISVMNDVLVDGEISLEKFAQVFCYKKTLKVHHHQSLANQDIATASARIKSRFRAHSFGSVFVKKGLSRRIRKEEIMSMLKEHIMRNVVKLGNNFYLQNVGIPQGSVLSSLLCSIYYGHMESNVVFPCLEKANKGLIGAQDSPGTSVSGGNHREDMVVRGCEYLMLRLTDDYLFISTSEKQASMFFSRMERGVVDYNCCMNQEKYGLNFIMRNRQDCPSNRVHVGKDGTSFLPWSGILVNCSTLELQADYTRYLNCHLSSSLTVIYHGKVGSHLKMRLRSYLRPKCHPLFYDSNINSPGVVRLNIYQAFLLSAMKLVCYISNLSTLPKFTPEFCINVINTSLRYMDRLIKRKMHSFESTFRPKYDVKSKEVIWLGLQAYNRVIKKKQSRNKDLLSFLKFELKAHSRVHTMSDALKFAIDDAHSFVLWSIKY